MISLTVDLSDPGQFFACCGIFELSHSLFSADAVQARFRDGRFELVGLEPSQFVDGVKSLIIDDDLGCKEQCSFRYVPGKKTLQLTWAVAGVLNTTRLKVFAAQQRLAAVESQLRDALPPCEQWLMARALPTTKKLTVFKWSAAAGRGSGDVGYSIEPAVKEYCPWVDFLVPIGLQRFSRPVDETWSADFYAWQDWLRLPSAILAAGTGFGRGRQFRFSMFPTDAQGYFRCFTEAREISNDKAF